MTTIVIDTRSKEAQRLVEYLKTIKYVKVLDSENAEPDEAFVEKIKTREKQEAVKMDIKNLWK